MSILPKDRTILSALQSRIDKRRNEIRSTEALIADDKAFIQSQRAEGHLASAQGYREFVLKPTKASLVSLVKEQKLDKKLYLMALNVEREDRFYDMMFDSIDTEF